MGASTAAKGPRAKHPTLRLLEDTGRKPGFDAAGRKIEEPPPFSRKLPEKPANLSADAAWMWDRVVDQMGSVGVLKPLDGPALEVICETFARWREAVRIRQNGITYQVPTKELTVDGKPIMESEARPAGILSTNSQGLVAAPWVGVEERAARDFRAWCAEFGLTPAAEKNLVSGPEGKGGMPGGAENPFA